ncbi:MAG: hypothetical protein JWO06_2379 [Bacteroidota bacterium]|nr:hypothetical protein [Bacteroidota bacterium]
MYKRILPVLVAAILIGLTANASQTRKVLFIGIDGTRSDALQQANTPNLDAMFAAQGLSYDAWCAGITISGPTWSSMLTGVWFDKHGITNNSYGGSNFNQYPYFTTLAKQVKPDLYCAEVCEWPPLIDDVYNDNFNLRLHTPDGQGATTCSVASTVLANDSIDFMFVYFDQVDLAGHSSGFSPTNPAYMTAIENVDSSVGVVMNALHNRTNYANEDWLVIVMTDHGGTGNGHGGNSDAERHIWWIANGNDLQHVTPSGADPGSYNSLIVGIFTPASVDTVKLRQTPVHTDVAVTALHHLLFDTGNNPTDNPLWSLDGKSWLATAAGIQSVEDKIQLKVFPNPASDYVAIYFTNNEKQNVTATLFDMQGRQVQSSNQIITTSKMNMSLKGLPAGQYQLSLKVGSDVVSKSLIIQ